MEEKDAAQTLFLRAKCTFEELDTAFQHVQSRIDTHLFIKQGSGESKATYIQGILNNLDRLEKTAPLSTLRTWVIDLSSYARALTDITSDITKMIAAHDIAKHLNAKQNNEITKLNADVNEWKSRYVAKDKDHEDALKKIESLTNRINDLETELKGLKGDDNTNENNKQGFPKRNSGGYIDGQIQSAETTDVLSVE